MFSRNVFVVLFIGVIFCELLITNVHAGEKDQKKVHAKQPAQKGAKQPAQKGAKPNYKDSMGNYNYNNLDFIVSKPNEIKGKDAAQKKKKSNGWSDDELEALLQKSLDSMRDI
ncbi:uncharacterized protein LOC116347282 isoform X1 [Contarinia nasturtii]|uniref:uncharacterized protein LOC116347282 isoform X1 n=1 Tax=Contarinia nasturtii TaxID=265458 RepID=UPI0012D45574|nr:uncharacterized protein LOC116347282 isoform X1 [Contarinia nasturtii]